MSKSLLSKFILFSYGTWVSLIIGLFTVAISTRILPPDSFGKSSLFTTIVSLLVVFAMVGADQAYVRFYYDLDNNSRKLLLLKCLSFPSGIILIIFSILVIEYKGISDFIFGEESFTAIIILSLSLFFEILSRYSLLLIRLEQRANAYSFIIILSKIVELLSIIVLYKLLGSNYMILPISFTITSFISCFAAILYTHTDWNFKPLLSERNLKTPTLVEIYKFSYPLMFSLILFWAFTSVDKIVLNTLSNYSEVGIYASASKLIFLMTAVQSAFTTFWTPISQERFSLKPDDYEFFKKSSRFVSLVIMVLMVLLIMFKDVFILILGNDYTKSSLLMPFLIFGPAMYTISETTIVGIAFQKKTKWNIAISLSVSIINIFGNLLLVPILGALGASISTAISYIILLILRTVISKRFYKVDYPLTTLITLSTIIILYSFVVSLYNLMYLNFAAGIFVVIIILIAFRNETILITKEIRQQIRIFIKRINHTDRKK